MNNAALSAKCCICSKIESRDNGKLPLGWSYCFNKTHMFCSGCNRSNYIIKVEVVQMEVDEKDRIYQEEEVGCKICHGKPTDIFFF